MAKDPNKEPAHSERSPSSSHRWIHCPGSVEMCKSAPPDKGSAASTRGTGGHALAVELLSGHDYGVGDVIKFEDDHVETSMKIDDDLLSGVTVYVDHINTTAEYCVEPRLFLEQVVKFHGEKGTADAILIDGVTLHIMDYKNGRWAVLLKEEDGSLNTQVMIYAYAALKKYDKNGSIERVVLHVIQPHSPEVNQIQTETIDAQSVRTWGDTFLKEAVKATKVKNAPLITGDWCQFCPAAGVCPALLAQVNDVAAADFAAVAQPVLPDVQALTIAQKANVMKWAPILESFVAAVMASAFDDMTKGAIYPGFKLVHKKTNREWPELIETTQALLDRLNEVMEGKLATADIKPAQLLAPPKLASPAQVEKINKSFKAAVAKLAKKPEGDLTVAPDSDPRDPVHPGNDFKKFTGAEDLV